MATETTARVRATPAVKVQQRPRRNSYVLEQIGLYAALLGLSALFTIPFIWLVLTSLKPPAEVFSNAWIGSDIHTQNYSDVFHQAPVLTWLKNSTIIALLGVVAVVFSSSLVAYGFARLRFRGRKPLFALVVATYMLPSAATMVPTFLIWNKLGFVGSFIPLWAPNLFGSAFYIFLLRQFLFTIPQDLVDAARVDGAGFFRIYWNIMLPLIMPALIAVAIFEFQAKWNDFQNALIYLNDPQKYTMSLGLASFKQVPGMEGQWALWMAASVIFTIPMIVVFFIGQRYFIQGVATTGLK
ncbi:MAG TPA: carbohydrate ABC transporter permease [Thermomicrobiales bacterium]|nr:carbohydrate ABC transporter permease [Thermomicrobiales bacterium]